MYNHYLTFLSQMRLTKVPRLQIEGRSILIDISSIREWKISILVGQYDEDMVDYCADLFFKQDGGLCYCSETHQIYLVFYCTPPKNYGDFELMLTSLLERFQLFEPLLKR